MCRFKFRLLVAFLTFGIGVLGVSLWIFQSPTQQNPINELKPVPPQSLSLVENEHPKLSALQNDNLIINPSGWLIPDISKLKKSGRRVKWEADFQGANVYATSYETSGLELSVMNRDGSIDPVNKVSVHQLTVFDIDNRAFCYRMLFWSIPPRGQHGVGAVIYHTYYDLDGDGKFETWDIRDTPREPLRMPKWAKP